MSGGLASFGDYDFQFLQEYSDNFSDPKPNTVQFPGVDGGWNVDGAGAPPTAVGKVSMGFYLDAETREEMDDLRDAVSALVHVGEDVLVYQPTEPTDSPRWTFARVNNIWMSQKKQKHTDLMQKVQIIFQCPEPVWWVNVAGGWQVGDGSQVGETGLVIGGSGTTIAASGVLTASAITQNGNTLFVPEIVVAPGVGNSCEDVIIRRKVGTVVVDEIAYTGVLGATDELSINGRTQRVDVNGASAWDDIAVVHPDLFRLVPGDNSIEVVFANAGDVADVIFYFRHAYR
jgi:hypothetical protein